MRSFFILGIILLAALFAVAQNEQSPIVEKDIEYRNWTYKQVQTGGDLNLREFTKGKKLVAVVYFAPWCPNWKHDAPMLQRLYEKYKDNGFAIVAVGEYDPVSSMKSNIETLKLTFPAVYESENRSEKQKTLHYQYRQSTGDTRGWGSPWYIFLDIAHLEKKGEILTKHAPVINGEMVEAEGEKFIRKQLGLPLVDEKTAPVTTQVSKVEACDPQKPTAALRGPQ
jgi:thiol-disulfide isomerase/thioredoxin